jgi:hypothetical protein
LPISSWWYEIDAMLPWDTNLRWRQRFEFRIWSCVWLILNV